MGASRSPATANRFCMNKILAMDIIIFKYVFISINDRVGLINHSHVNCYVIVTECYYMSHLKMSEPHKKQFLL